METLLSNLSPKRAFTASAAVLVLFGMLSYWVWRNQRRHEIVILEKHTDDVAIQASRRLKVFVESHLRVATIFAERWATHENADFSKKRFEEFASVIIDRLPGYAAIALVSSDTSVMWAVPAGKDVSRLTRSVHWKEGVSMLRTKVDVYLSAPLDLTDDHIGFFALLPLLREGESLGHLLILFHSKTLVTDCFHSRIKSEFHFRIQDRERLLFQSSPSRQFEETPSPSIRSDVSFDLRNRTWTLTMMPREAGRPDWTRGLLIALFGVLFSTGISAMTFLLVRRVDMYRVARDKALTEIAGRRQAEEEREVVMKRLARLSQKAMAAQEEERARLSVEMHDELGQLLTALRLNLELWEQRLRSEYGVPGEPLSKAAEMADTATDELRRLCKGLRPPLLDDLGLVAAVRLLVEEFRKHAGIEIALELPSNERKFVPNDIVALTAYRILQESLTNIRRHAEAKTVTISVIPTNRMLTITIADDGRGFDMSGLNSRQGCGLQGMRERAALAGGHVDIATAPGQGTRVTFSAPLHPDKTTETK